MNDARIPDHSAWAARGFYNRAYDYALAAITALRAQLAEVREEISLERRISAHNYDLFWQANARADRAEEDITSLTASCAELATENEQLRAERDDYAYKLNAANDTYTEMHLEIERWRDRADRAEAALAAQIEADAGIARHRHAVSEDAFQKGLGAENRHCALEAIHIADKIAAQPHDRTALDRMRRAEREKALREAAKKATSFLVGDPLNGVPLRNPMAHEVADAIRALIEQDGA